MHDRSPEAARHWEGQDLHVDESYKAKKWAALYFFCLQTEDQQLDYLDTVLAS